MVESAVAVHSSWVVSFMLRAAKTPAERRIAHQAIFDYFNIIEQKPETNEAKEAYKRLVRTAQSFEGNGQLYAAKHLYQRLEEEHLRVDATRP